MIIYLFGSTGMIGNYIFELLKKSFDVIPINRNQFDINKDNWNKLKNTLKNLKKDDIIINCAGIVPQTKITDSKQYIKVNSIFPHKLEEISLNIKCKFIHITTDCVFKGDKGKYIESDNHNEVNIYGVSKSTGEPDNACIIRTSFIGHQISSHNGLGLLEWIISQNNKKINGFTNHYWNGITCLTLANIIKSIIDKKLFWKGCRHIFSPNSVTKYDLCQYISEIYDLNITIDKHETEEDIDKTISTEFLTNDLFNISTIREQIKDQKLYSIIH